MISFVGAGPGATDLLTLRAADRLAKAQVVIWASSLIPPQILELCQASPDIFDSAGMTLEDVLHLYQTRSTERIVRLHSGDPAIYGATGEQIEYCEQMGLAYEVVPGVTSVTAAAAMAGRELTLPGISQSLVITRLAQKTSASIGEDESLEHYARAGGTLAVLLSGAYPEKLQAALLCPGSKFSPATSALVAVRASWEDGSIHPTTLGELATTMRATGASRTVLVIVGDVLSKSKGRSHLYDPTFAHKYRKRSLPGETSGRPTKVSKSSLK